MEFDELNRNQATRFEGNLNFSTFADAVYVLLEKLWGKEWGKFLMERPSGLDAKNVKMPTITYQLRKIEPGDIGRGQRERKPRKRGSYEILFNGEKRTVIEEGQIMDAEVVFTVYATSNLEAIQTTDAFMDVIHTGKGFLLKKGLRNIWFKENIEKDIQSRENIIAREVVYDVKFERIFKTMPGNIESIDVEADTLYDILRKEGLLPSDTVVIYDEASETSKNKED